MSKSIVGHLYLIFMVEVIWQKSIIWQGDLSVEAQKLERERRELELERRRLEEEKTLVATQKKVGLFI